MIQRVKHSRPGQALVEFALVVPILLLLVFGIIEFARAWQTYQTLTDAAREGARRAVVRTASSANTAEAAAAMQEVADSVKASLRRASLDPGRATVNPSVPAGEFFPGSTGIPVTVQIDYQFQFIVIGRLIGWTTGQDRITFSTSSVMRKE
jgi:Flp pilus assembly protein TadG